MCVAHSPGVTCVCMQPDVVSADVDTMSNPCLTTRPALNAIVLLAADEAMTSRSAAAAPGTAAARTTAPSSMGCNLSTNEKWACGGHLSNNTAAEHPSIQFAHMSAATAADGGFDFLPDVDESIFHDLDMSSTASSGYTSQDDATAPTLHLVKHNKKKRPNKVLIELMSLQHDQVELERQLFELERQRALRMEHSTSDVAKWEQMARHQLALKIKAVRENEELRSMLVEQTAYQHQLESMVLKKPRFMMMKLQDDQWRVLQLSADGDKRLTAIHAIADRQLESIEGDMITSGLADAPDEFESFRYATEGLQRTAEAMASSIMHGTLFDASNAAWHTLQFMQTRGRSTHVPSDTCTYTIDDDTLYIRSRYTLPSSKLETNVILKRTVAAGRVVHVVWRTVLGDDAMPFSADSFVSDQCGWMTIVRGHAPHTVVCKAYYKAVLANSTDDSIHTLSQMMREIHLRDAPVDMTSVDVMHAAFENGFRAFAATMRRYMAT
ncbi:hypothetical protein, variant 1 [Aphanomyces invadans]|uniref:Uncharacterized protein n=1 Tax=Aphanomyces invadans TaxID=157072 RepID=A0A024TKU1_9STRA|nr:hypothetical protein, variant 1 [Aphanomyces invadans]ETV93927.1 hypothetical protein, variant 1 [Aphanomyces invadans]|eukprot:XP_008877487.1 hypothetical protein, variant 1 [Aphanomyces invadans]